MKQFTTMLFTLPFILIYLHCCQWAFSIDTIHLIHGATTELVLKSCKHKAPYNDACILCLL